ncbi:MAG: shikimate kinase [Halieaceae bacterium]|jgi:shikimate kinase|nr:shikimate kinase [Halieaceae bacterium]
MIAGKPISLIGMPGSGKSTVGVLLAKRLGFDFVDTDLLIQARENATLAEIIARTDHQYLRDLEERVLLEMPIEHGVISTGGSVVYSPAIMARLGAATTLVYLRARVETVTYRISLAPDRGIASPGGHTLEDIYAERVPLYERYADITVDADDEPPETIVGHIIAALDTL